ncbi:MAG TPA: DUF2076 family protein [Caulobacteraceae bacterium]|jgi:hypothetical protein
MTPDERILLSNFLRDLAQARASGKDAEAEGMIKEAFAANPDAAYLIVQHAILSDQALQTAQQRIAQLEGGGQSASFLGGGRPQSTAVPPSQPYAPQTAYDPQPPPYAPQQPSSPFSSGGGLGSFLRSAGTMAAGVAAGDFLFEGVSGLFGGHRGFGFGGGGFGGGGFGGFGGGPSVENVTINEYGDDHDGDFTDQGDFDDDGGGWDNS